MLIYKDRDFFPTLLTLVVPVLVQNFLNASLNFIDVLMIGSLGDASIAAVGGANQFFFFFLMIIFGISSGAGIFTAQFWGSRDIDGIKSVMGIGVVLSMSVSLLFTSVVIFSPQTIIGLFSRDPDVISIGSRYVLFTAGTYMTIPLTLNFGVILGSIRMVKIPMYASFIGVGLNTLGNYCLIFGKWGFPQMGVEGAAISTVISRSIETSIIVGYSYLCKSPAAVGLEHIFNIDGEMFRRYLKRSIPVIIQRAGWSFGYATYSIIYGHVSTESLAAYNLAASIERIGHILFVGLGAAGAIMIGNSIGAGQEHKARGYAINILQISFIGATLIGLCMFGLREQFTSLYSLTPTGRQYLSGILMVMAFVLSAKAFNIVFHGAIFRGGGDTLFSMIVDVGGVWLVGVPLAAYGAFVLHWPVHYIVALAAAEEVTKAAAAFVRFVSNKWIHNLVRKRLETI
ncbi:MAG: MATE family efflux transporter [Chitinispirillaceae bacterium]